MAIKISIEIGNTIRRLRQQNAVTQEFLGEYLGLTAQAVSRWESGICYPDIEILPTLAAFFGVTTDELLCVDKTKSIQRINKYLDEAERKEELGKYDEIITLMRQALEKYPNSAQLKLTLANALVSAESEAGINEACEICKFFLKNPRSDEQQKGEARRILCTAYTFRMKNEVKTEEIINEMANWNYSRDLFAAKFLTGKSGHQQMRDNLKWLVDNVWSIMMNFCSLEDTYVANQYSLDEKVRIAEKCIALLELIFDGDYIYYCTRVCDTYILLSKLYIMAGREELSCECIKNAAKYASDYDKRPDEAKYSCLLLRDVAYRKHQWRENKEHTECYYIFRHLSDSIYDCIRETEEFAAIYDSLEKKVCNNEENIV